MKRLLLSLVLAVSFVGPSLALDEPDIASMSNAEIKRDAAELHPAAMYILAARLLEDGDAEAAAGWMYAGRLRYRFLLAAGSSRAETETASFDVLEKQIGRKVAAAIADRPEAWLAAIDRALRWDAANDNPITSKTGHAAALESARRELSSLREKVETGAAGQGSRAAP